MKQGKFRELTYFLNHLCPQLHVLVYIYRHMTRVKTGARV